jgi:hypothetical protein
MAAATNPNQNSSSNQNTNPVDAKEFYGYLYEANKTPTKVLDALLRAIGQYIVSPPNYFTWLSRPRLGIKWYDD